ncbi:MAG: MMPL family transporter [Agathobacter sp.]|nr:MMPL family transporter [Agathobacter sp.]
MEPKQEKGNVMEIIAQFIVDKRNLFFFIYIVAIIFSIFAMNWKQVETDVTVYLNEESETRQGLTTMNEHFAMFSSARVMISNVTYDEAKALYDEIVEVDGITMVDFSNKPESYKDAYALLSVTFDGKDLDQETIQAVENIKSILTGYDYVIDTTVGYDQVADLGVQMMEIMGYAVVVIVLGLILTSTAYAELPVLGLTFGAAILLGMGTNFLLGKISFISDSVGMLLQLAMGIDYGIILVHRFSAERAHLPAREACIKALSKAIPEITSSSLTTIGGLFALSFMDFGIGKDLSIVLIKGVVLILIAVFTLMPGLLMLFSPLIDKTRHKNLLPDVSFIGKFCAKARWIITPIFLFVLVGAFFLSNACPFTYSTMSLRRDNMSERQEAYFKVNDIFGTTNMIAILVPTGDYEAEAQILKELDACEEVKSTMGLANTELMDGYMLTDSLNARELSEVLGLDYDMVEMLYTMYAMEDEQYGKLLDMDSYRVPIFDLFCFLKDTIESTGMVLEGEMAEMTEMLDMLDMAKEQLQTEEYSRLVVYADLPDEGEETYAFLEKIHEIADKHYSKPVYAIGNSTSCRDLGSTFATDNTIISILSIVFVIAVLLFTFKSVGLPILLIVVIQGAIWMNFSFPTLTDTPLYFLGYLIVSSLQMGCNIDYAIVISSHFNEEKKHLPVEEAIAVAVNKAFPTVLTSGTIMAVMGFLLGGISTEPTNAVMGECIGRGTLISMILVLFVLPCILVIGDKIIEATRFDMKGVKVDMSEYEEFGKMRVKGRIHGWVEGVIDGEVDAVVLGRVHAAVISNNLFIDMQEQDIYAVEKAKEAYVTEMNEAEVTNKDMEEGGNDDEV